MRTAISRSILENAMLAPGVARANQILEHVIGPSSQHVTAEWSLAKDSSGRQLVLLILSDTFEARTEARFEPHEFLNDGQLYAKFYRIWGDLLQSRSHKQLDILSGRIDIGGTVKSGD